MDKVSWQAENARLDSAEKIKAWLQPFNDNLIAAGLVRADDTGQLDISAISAVPVAGAFLAPLIYRLADSRQISEPVYIKFRPYVGQFGGSTYTAMNLMVSIGTGTDGAGNITGLKVPEFNHYNSSSGSPRVWPIGETTSYAIHTEGRFSICLGIGAYTRSADSKKFCMLFLDVTRHPSTAGFSVIKNNVAYYPQLDANASQVVAKLNATDPANAFRQDMTPWVGGQEAATLNGATQMQRTYKLSPGVVADTSLALYWSAVVAPHSQFVLAIDGSPRNYLAIGSVGMFASTAVGDAVGLAMLWDDL